MCIRDRCVNTRDFRNQKIDVNDYFGIIFTSKIALDYFFSLLEQSRINISVSYTHLDVYKRQSVKK